MDVGGDEQKDIGASSQVASNPAASDLVALLYDELHAIARREYHFGGRPQTLQATSLIGEVYLKMQKQSVWANEGHFLGCAATAMRNFMVDAARARLADKRTGQRESLTAALAVASKDDSEDEQLVRLHTALKDLERHDADLAKLVEYRFFIGLDEIETARAMNVSDRTVRRRWTRARAWIYSSMTEPGPA